MIVSQPIAKESTRWYSQDGKSIEDTMGRNGSLRAVTLRDARKPDNQWIPSVTSIIAILAKPQLERWKMEQVAGAGYDIDQQMEAISKEEYLERTLKLSSERMSEAREKGSDVHGEIDRFLMEGSTKTYIGSSPHVKGAVDALIDSGLAKYPLVVEKPFTAFVDSVWVAGKCDLHFPEHKIIWDWKTTSKPCDGSTPLGYDEHVIQLAAYSMALFGSLERGINCFVSTAPGNEGRTEIVEWLEEEMERGWEIYKHLFHLWCLQKKYVPQTLSGQSTPGSTHSETSDPETTRPS